MESARRWAGYVCPDCRFVFRVPRDHDGKGIVCPSCRRLLKIPAAGDVPPPLTASVRRMEAEESEAENGLQGRKKRRRGKTSRGSGSHSWEQKPYSSRNVRGEKRQMRLMLIGGVMLLVLIVGGVIFSLNTAETPAPPPLPETVTTPTPAVPPVALRSEAELAAEAEPLVRKFLEATTVEELLPLVRDPAVAEERIRAFYPGGKVEAPGLSKFNANDALALRDDFISASVTTGDHEEKSIALMETPQGWKIDWESWVGWSTMPWETFISAKPTTGQVFRVNLSEVDYYNFTFADETQWQSYRLESPDRSHSIYGYVAKGSMLEQQVRPGEDSKNVTLMLSLKFPAGATSDSQVEIERFVTEGWVEKEDSP